MPEEVTIDTSNLDSAADSLGVDPNRAIITDAAAALGLDEPISVSLKRAQDKSNSWNPPSTAAKDDFMPPAPKLPEPEDQTDPSAAPEPKPTEGDDPEDQTDPPAAPEPEGPKPSEDPPEPKDPEKKDDPPATPDPTKVKVGDREYTQEELQELVNKANQSQLPTKDPDKPEDPPKPKELTPEEVAQREQAFIAEQAAKLDFKDVVKDDDIEALLVGGEKAVDTLSKVMKETTARAILEARRSIFAEVGPYLQNLESQVRPVIEQTQQLDTYTTTQLFEHRHPEFKEAGQMDLVRSMGEEIAMRYPEQVRKMTREQFVDEVARQVDPVVQQDYKRFHPSADGSWKDFFKGLKNPLKQDVPPAPTGVTTTPTEPKTPPAPKTPDASPPEPQTPPKPKPPAASNTRLIGGKPLDWHKKTAQELAMI